MTKPKRVIIDNHEYNLSNTYMKFTRKKSACKQLKQAMKYKN